MDANEFVDLSGKIAAMGKAGARSAVRRTYYGAFHLALQTLDVIASAPPANGKAHNLVPIFLKSANHPDGNAAGNLLADLHGDRIKVDYRLGDSAVETLRFAQLKVETAVEIKRFLAAFQVACANDVAVRQALKDGIEKVKASYKL